MVSRQTYLSRLVVSLCIGLALVSYAAAQSKNPLILIPGLTGSELRDKKTHEKIWIKAFTSDKSDDLRLPISVDIISMSDDLEAGDVIRDVEFAGFSVR